MRNLSNFKSSSLPLLWAESMRKTDFNSSSSFFLFTVKSARTVHKELCNTINHGHQEVWSCMHITPVLSELNWLSVNRTLLNNKKLKQRSHFVPVEVLKDTLLIPLYHSTAGKRMFLHWAVKTRNNLPDPWSVYIHCTFIKTQQRYLRRKTAFLFQIST